VPSISGQMAPGCSEQKTPDVDGNKNNGEADGVTAPSSSNDDVHGEAAPSTTNDDVHGETAPGAMKIPGISE
jgi:hypothetical protein